MNMDKINSVLEAKVMPLANKMSDRDTCVRSVMLLYLFCRSHL